MDQQKIGEFLKNLRKERGLTQEQLAERFYVSNRTVSRWENGKNLPDVGTLLELADFYDVDIRELIDGEKNKAHINKASKETLLEVAEYATEGEKQSQSVTLYTVLCAAAALFLSTVLFSTESTGLLYGIIPADICYRIIAVVYGLVFFLLVFCLRVLPFREQPAGGPIISVAAEVVSKEVKRGTNSSGRSRMGYSFAVNFLTEDGQNLELYAYEVEFGGLKEGMKGILTYRGRYFVDFQKTE